MTSETFSGMLSLMRELGIDVVALAPTDSFRHALGFSPFPDERFCALLIASNKQALVIPSINAEDVRREVGDIPMMEWQDGDGPEEALRHAVSHLELADDIRIAVDPEMRADALITLQRALPSAAFIDGSAVLRPLRQLKSAHELERLLASAQAADLAMEKAFSACASGATELDVAAAAVEGFQSAGVESISFTIVASGPNGAFPHHHTGSRKLSSGDAVVVDLGAKLAHYSSDITRMAFIGDPSARYNEVHEAVERAVTAAVEVIHPGVTCGAIDAAARDMITEAGFGEYFVHRTGHGLGLSMHEPPWIVPGSEEPVKEGMVFSIEPGIYLPGEFGVRLEEIVHVTASGCRAFSALPRDVHVA